MPPLLGPAPLGSPWHWEKNRPKGRFFFALSRPHLMPYFAGSLCAAKDTKPPPPSPSFPPGFTIRKKSTRLCQLLEIGAPASTNLPAAAAKPPTNISDIPAQRNKTSVILLRSQGKNEKTAVFPLPTAAVATTPQQLRRWFSVTVLARNKIMVLFRWAAVTPFLTWYFHDTQYMGLCQLLFRPRLLLRLRYLASSCISARA